MKNEGIKYIINLKWIKPLKGKIQYETKLAEFIPMVAPHNIKKGKNNGVPSIKSRVFLPEFIRLATAFGFQKKKKRFIILETEDREAYFRLFVYSVVRQSIRSEIKASTLPEIIRKLPYTELKYWANIFSKYYKEYNTRRSLYKPTRAFREVYGLD